MEGSQPFFHKPIIPQNTSNQYFKGVICSAMLKEPGINVFGDVNLSTVLRTRAVS
jgi:hypothetical protein